MHIYTGPGKMWWSEVKNHFPEAYYAFERVRKEVDYKIDRAEWDTSVDDAGTLSAFCRSKMGASVIWDASKKEWYWQYHDNRAKASI